MRRMDSMEKEGVAFRGMSVSRQGLWPTALTLAGCVIGLVLAASPAAATPATLNSVFGFNEAGLEGLESGVLTVEDEFLMAGESVPGLDVVLSGSTDLCIFTASNPVCQSTTSGITGAYSAYVTVTVDSTPNPAIDGPFTLFLSGRGPSYSESEVQVELDPTVEPGLDTSGIAGFNLIPFAHIIDETFGTPAAYHYIGWQVQVGDTFSFRYDVSTAPNGRPGPQLTANAIARPIVPRVIPEPGTALLMGLGLAGLSVAQRRLEPARG